MKKMMTLMSALVIGIWGSMLSAQGPPDIPSPGMAYHASTGVSWLDIWSAPPDYLSNTAKGGAVSERETPALHMTMAQRDAIAGPDKGLQIFNLDLLQAEVYDGVSWVKLENIANEAGGFEPMPPAGNYWTQKADFGGTERAYAVGFSINNKGYIGTGHDGSFKRDFWEFDPESNVWSQMADFGGTPRYAAVGFSIGNKGYLGNGFDGLLRNDFWEYDPFTNTWAQRADYGGTGSEGAIGFSIGGKGYMGTGNSNGVFKNDLWEYNPITDAWTQMPDLPGTGRCFGVGFSIGTKGYVGTGTTGMYNIFKDFWEFDPTTLNWTRKADLTGDARKMAVGFSIGKRGYIGTGAPGPYGGENRDFWEYDPDVNSWTRIADLAGTGRRLAVGFSVGNKGYIGTGVRDYSGPTNKTVWEYTPIVPPVLGSYPDVSVMAGQNTTVTPVGAPSNTTSMVGYTNTNFTGIFAVDPATGVVTITNANQVGVYPVTIQAFNGLVSTKATFILTVTQPVTNTVSFAVKQNLGVGMNPGDIAVGDFNGDGKQDLVAENHLGDNISICLGDGSGGFVLLNNVSVARVPNAVAVGDFNGDGNQDIATATYLGNAVSIRLGDGNGNFGGTTEVPCYTGLGSIALGDFNDDGHQDMVVGYVHDNRIGIILGHGNGSFGNTTLIHFNSYGNNSADVAIGDFNGDAKQDIVSINSIGNTITILLGNGAGSFTNSSSVLAGISTQKVSIGDFNGDGLQDLAITNYSNNSVSIRLGDGKGNFYGSTDIPVGNNPYGIALGDFNGDGFQDFATANMGNNTVSIRLGNGAGDFGSPLEIPVGATPISVVVGDFNGDGKEDLATADYNSNNVSIILNEGIPFVSPVIVCPPDIRVNNTTGMCGAIVDFSATETIGNPASVITYSQDPGTFFPVGKTEVIATAVNQVGTSVCTFMVEVIDNEKPVPDVLTLPEITGECAAAVTAPTATDNCAGVITGTTTDPASYTTQGTFIITWTFDDGNGNVETQQQTVVVKDITRPVPDVTDLPEVTGECTASVTVPTATDHCTGVITGTTTDPTVYTTQGTFIITWTYDDGNGNVVTQQQTVVVKDVTYPVAVCKATTVSLIGGVASITAADVDGGSSDNCGIQSITVSPKDFDCSEIGDNMVTLTVTDIAGNVSTCTAVVTVLGEVPACSITSVPENNTFTGGIPANLYLGYGPQSTTLQVNAPASGAPYTYAWSGGTLSNYHTANPVFTATTAGTFTFSVLVTNKYGCTTTCSITICVTDIRVPGTNGSKVYVCHMVAGKSANRQTLAIGVSAVPAHLGQHEGDKLGSCDMQPCTAPLIVGKKSAVSTGVESLTVIVSPNPTHDNFTFRLRSENETPVTIRLYNSGGQVQESAERVNANGTVQMGGKLSGGLYFAEFRQGTSRQVIKLIKR